MDGSNTDLPLGVPVTLTNNGNGGAAYALFEYWAAVTPPF